jgi:hypothetical protein
MGVAFNEVDDADDFVGTQRRLAAMRGGQTEVS